MKHIFLTLFCAALLAISGCQSQEEPKTPLSSFTDSLQGDALATHAAYMKAGAPGTGRSGNEIPERYWGDRIKALTPIKVYTHSVNVVVVQRVGEGVEEGKYIYIPISSYYPMTGDDGFVFTPVPEDGTLNFTRTRSE